MDAKLVVVGGDTKTTEIQLKLPTIIGRGKDCKLRLQHPLISRQHCEIFEASGQLMVRDLGSLNGTFINNERITEAALPAGQLLTVGAVTFRAVYGEGSQTAADDLNKTAGLGKTLATEGKMAIADTAPIADDPPTGDPTNPVANIPSVPEQAPAKPAGATDESMDFDLTDVEEVEEIDDASGILPPSAIPKGALKPAPGQPHAPMALPPAAMPISSPAAQPMAHSHPPSPTGAPVPNPDEEDDDLNSFLKSLGK